MSLVITLEKKYLSNRSSGTNLRLNIEKLIKGKRATVTINGAEITGISESYADEVFGILAKNLGKKRFFSTINFIGFNDADLGVIATVLQRRWG